MIREEPVPPGQAARLATGTAAQEQGPAAEPEWLTQARAAERGEGPGGVWKLTGPGSASGPALEQGAAVNNAQLSRELIAKHGIDRYPTPALNALKLFEEAGEMVRHILRDSWAGEEMADVAICLYVLADKMGVDLDEQIRTKVENETRRFG
jgi:NTP pyrophosphatase (non-canonical NTP hydrolase)